MMAKTVPETPDMVVFEPDDEFTDSSGKIVKPSKDEVVRVFEYPEVNMVVVQNISIVNSGQVRWEVNVEGGTREAFVNIAVRKSKES